MFGVRQEDNHWSCFDDSGDLPGKFESIDSARWGGWVIKEDAERINDVEQRLITMNDIGVIISTRLKEKASS